MLTYLLIFIMILMFLRLIVHWWPFKNSVEKIDMEKELYQQLLKSARARSQEKIDTEWELYQQRYD